MPQSVVRSLLTLSAAAFVGITGIATVLNTDLVWYSIFPDTHPTVYWPIATQYGPLSRLPLTVTTLTVCGHLTHAAQLGKRADDYYLHWNKFRIGESKETGIQNAQSLAAGGRGS
eukprot:gene3667-4092_t